MENIEALFNNKWIDLTLPYDEDVGGYSWEMAKTVEHDGWNARTLHLYSHAGTHMDAPLHFGLQGTIDQFTPNQLTGKAWIADLVGIEPGAEIFPEHLSTIQHNIKPGDSLILKTGWSQYAKNRNIYRNQLPRISEPLAHWLVERGIKMLGVEPPSVADVNNLEEVTRIHQILLQGNVLIIEGLTNLDQIQSTSILLFAFPLKIKGGDGAPARVMAVELD